MNNVIEINPHVKPWNKSSKEELPALAKFVAAYEYREMFINKAVASLFITQDQKHYTLWSAIHLDGTYYNEWSDVLIDSDILEVQKVVVQKRSQDKTKAISRMISIYKDAMTGLAVLEQRVL